MQQPLARGDSTQSDSLKGFFIQPYGSAHRRNIFPPGDQEVYDHPALHGKSSFERLKCVHKVAPTPLVYDPGHPHHHLLKISGTSLATVLTQMVFYAIVGSHILFQVLIHRVYKEKKWPKIEQGLLTVCGSLLTFSLVFFTNQAYNRFFTQYLAVRKIGGQYRLLCMMIRTVFHDGLLPQAGAVRRELWRKLTATIWLGFIFLPSFKEKGIHRWGYTHLLETRIMSPEDLEALESTPPFLKHYEALTGASQLLWHFVEQQQLHQHTYEAFEQRLQDIHLQFSTLLSHIIMPVPFAYYHLLYLSILSYLFIMSYAWAQVSSAYFSTFVFVLVAFLLLALHRLASALADPFGHDNTDIPVFDYVNQGQTEQEQLINRPAPFGPIPKDYGDFDDRILQHQTSSTRRDKGPASRPPSFDGVIAAAV